MKALATTDLRHVGGGRAYFPDDEIPPGGEAGAPGISGPVTVIQITASYADAAAARADYSSAQDAATFMTAAAGIGATALTTGFCIAVPAGLSGPAALEVAALAARPCAYIGGLAGSFTGIWVNGVLKAGIERVYN